MRNELALAAMLAAASLVSACAARAVRVPPPPQAPAHPELPPAPASAALYVARRRWHIDVGFEVAALPAPLAATASREFPGARYVFFGFGDRRYLLSKNRGAPVLVEALWPGPALILVTELEATPAQAFGAEHVIKFALDPEQAHAVQAFIWQSLRHNADSSPEEVAHGPYEGSAYFGAVPRYSGVHTCITWAAEALQSAGLPIHSRFTVVAGQLWPQVLKLARTSATSKIPRDDDQGHGGDRHERDQPEGDQHERDQRKAPDAATRDGAASVTWRRIAVLANDGRTTSLGDDDSGFGRRRRAAAADATGQ